MLNLNYYSRYNRVKSEDQINLPSLYSLLSVSTLSKLANDAALSMALINTYKKKAKKKRALLYQGNQSEELSESSIQEIQEIKAATAHNKRPFRRPLYPNSSPQQGKRNTYYQELIDMIDYDSKQDSREILDQEEDQGYNQEKGQTQTGQQAGQKDYQQQKKQHQQQNLVKLLTPGGLDQGIYDDEDGTMPIVGVSQNKVTYTDTNQAYISQPYSQAHLLNVQTNKRPVIRSLVEQKCSLIVGDSATTGKRHHNNHIKSAQKQQEYVLSMQDEDENSKSSDSHSRPSVVIDRLQDMNLKMKQKKSVGQSIRGCAEQSPQEKLNEGNKVHSNNQNTIAQAAFSKLQQQQRTLQKKPLQLEKRETKAKNHEQEEFKKADSNKKNEQVKKLQSLQRSGSQSKSRKEALKQEYQNSVKQDEIKSYAQDSQKYHKPARNLIDLELNHTRSGPLMNGSRSKSFDQIIDDDENHKPLKHPRPQQSNQNCNCNGDDKNDNQIQKRQIKASESVSRSAQQQQDQQLEQQQQQKDQVIDDKIQKINEVYPMTPSYRYINQFPPNQFMSQIHSKPGAEDAPYEHPLEVPRVGKGQGERQRLTLNQMLKQHAVAKSVAGTGMGGGGSNHSGGTGLEGNSPPNYGNSLEHNQQQKRKKESFKKFMNKKQLNPRLVTSTILNEQHQSNASNGHIQVNVNVSPIKDFVVMKDSDNINGAQNRHLSRDQPNISQFKNYNTGAPYQKKKNFKKIMNKSLANKNNLVSLKDDSIDSIVERPEKTNKNSKLLEAFFNDN